MILNDADHIIFGIELVIMTAGHEASDIPRIIITELRAAPKMVELMNDIVDSLEGVQPTQRCAFRIDNPKTQHVPDVRYQTKQGSSGLEMIMILIEAAAKLLSHNEARIQHQAMEIISEGVPVLDSDENKLLLAIEQYWPPLIDRLNDEAAWIVSCRFEAADVQQNVFILSSAF